MEWHSLLASHTPNYTSTPSTELGVQLVERAIDSHCALLQFLDLSDQSYNSSSCQSGSPCGDCLTHPLHCLAICIRGINVEVFLQDALTFICVTVNMCGCGCGCGCGCVGGGRWHSMCLCVCVINFVYGTADVVRELQQKMNLK